jgi:hypothetical protein
MERLDRHVGRKRIPFEAIEREQLIGLINGVSAAMTFSFASMRLLTFSSSAVSFLLWAGIWKRFQMFITDDPELARSPDGGWNSLAWSPG